MFRKALGKIVFGIAALTVGGLLFAGCLATMVRSYDIETKVTYDGFGRKLVKAPMLVRWFDGGYQYPGMKWFIVDFVTFWVAVAVIYGLFVVGARLTGLDKEPKMPANKIP